MKYSTKEIRERALKAYEDKQPITEIAKMYQSHRATIYRWIKKFNKFASLERRTSPGSGRHSKLAKSDIKKLLKIILKPASKFGYETDYWSLKRIRQIIKEKFKASISDTAIRNILHKEKSSYKRPEKRYYEADLEGKNKWIKTVVPDIKKTSRNTVQSYTLKMKQAYH